MKSLRTPVVLALLVLFFCPSASGQFPWNPDADGNELIGSTDILEMLGVYGSYYQVTGVIEIENGGTGAADADSARINLGLSAIQDSTYTLGINVYTATWVEGDMRVSGEFAQGAGSVALGSYGHASGSGTEAGGAYSHAQNRNTIASGTCSSSSGENTEAIGTASHAEGMFTDATATTAHAEGYGSKAEGNYSHAEGYATSATQSSAHSEGYNTDAIGYFSHSEGRNTLSSATCSHAEGEGTSATADASHSEGHTTVASGFASHAEGYQTDATAYASSAAGYYTVADVPYQTVVGKYNVPLTSGSLFVVGNGVGIDDVSNALVVHDDGSLEVSGGVTAGGVVVLNAIDALSVSNDSLWTANDSLLVRIVALEAAVEQLLGGGE